MIQNNLELEAMQERIRYFRQQIERLREAETNPQNYRLSADGFLSEIDRMNFEVREYLLLHPNQFTNGYSNYTEERRKLYAGMSVADIVAEIEKSRQP